MHPFLEKLATKKATVVLAEAHDERVIKAAQIIAKRNIADLILLGDEKKISRLKKKCGARFDFPIINPQEYETDFSDKIVKIRKGKVTKKQAQELAKDVHYFAALLVREGLADAAVSGNLSPTADTLRAALQIIGTKPRTKAFSYFVMLNPKEKKPLLFGDCALNISPDAKLLASIAKGLCEEAQHFKMQPKVALLSYSTHSSGKGEPATRVRDALRIAKRQQLPVDELQFDAAVVPSIAKHKAPKSAVAGKANCFVFPSLMAGNIAYKVAERIGEWHAIGPMVWGLKQPMNDLSRGCSADDIVSVVHLTTHQVG